MKHSRHPQPSRRSSPAYAKGDRVEIYHAYRGQWIPAVFLKKLEPGPLLQVQADGARHPEFVNPRLVRDARQGGLEL